MASTWTNLKHTTKGISCSTTASRSSRASISRVTSSCVFFLNDTATTEIYTLSLHDALPIYSTNNWQLKKGASKRPNAVPAAICKDRKSTRLNSSHLGISYAVFGLKKKK